MELSLFFDVITAIAVTLGIIFGLLQLRHYHLSRERDATVLLLNSFQSDELFNGIRIIQELPPGLSKGDLEDRLGEKFKSVYLAMSIWDNIGLYVYKHELSIEMAVHSSIGLLIDRSTHQSTGQPIGQLTDTLAGLSIQGLGRP